MLPQLPYAAAVHTALVGMAFLPDVVEAGVRRESIDQPVGELFMRLEWLPGNDDLVPTGMHADGLVVQWSHLTGWSVRCGDDLVVLMLSDLADPALIVDLAMHAALHGLRCRCEGPPSRLVRWSEAEALHAALVRYDEGPVTS
ncbi:hypothetical protein [Streptomyces sp. NPDC047070]|uniref:hypothetical protein n=1 Tax=Streptomyces sp. NPDC047070 TaxID=3154923 RepID=UPI003452F660